MIAQAARSGKIEVHAGDPWDAAASGGALGEEIEEIMRRHGIDPDAGTDAPSVDAAAIAAMQQEILAALGRQGITPPGSGDAPR